jgi:prepilin-type N-terminal cleavage/methylation domain-containing protein
MHRPKFRAAKPLRHDRIAAPKAMNGITQKERHSQGFTLIEVLVATAILGVGLMAVATLISRAAIQDSRAYHASRGSLLVEEVLERAIRAQYSPQAFRSLTAMNASTVIEGIQFSMTCALAEDTPVERCRQMTCDLSFNNKGHLSTIRYIHVLSPKF